MNYSKNLNRDYIRKRISATQNISSEYENNLRHQMVENSYSILTSEAMENTIADNETNSLKSKLIHFGYKHKEFIRKIPFIGKKALEYKNEKYSQAVGTPLLDIRDSINKPYFVAIPELYYTLLDREPDEAGLNFYLACAREGASNGAVAYMIFISKEFAKRARIYLINEYKLQFRAFRKKHRIRKIPFIGHYYQRLEPDGYFSEKTEETSQYTLKRLETINTLVFQKAEENKNSVILKLEKLEADNDSIISKLGELEADNDSIISKLGELKADNDSVISKLGELEADNDSVVSKLGELEADNDSVVSKLDELGRISQELADIKEQIFRKLDEELSEIKTEISLIKKESLGVNQNVCGMLHEMDEKDNLMLSIATSISEKADRIPEYIVECAKTGRTSVASFPQGVIAINTGEFIMGIPGNEWGLAMFLSLYGSFEKGSEMLFSSVIQPGMTVIDVGANLGIYTLRALKAGCKVYSFEASPETYKLLNKNIKVNGFAESGRIFTYNKAVADKDGYTTFYVEKEMCGHSNMYGAETKETDTIRVETVALDNLLQDSGKIDFVKIDVEGAEYVVLKGMKKLIERNPRMKILIEFAPCNMERAGVSPGELLDLIKQFGLSYYLINNDTGTLSSVPDDELLCCYSENLLCLKEGNE